MASNKQRIIIALCILVAVIIIGLVFYSSHTVKENFEEKQKQKQNTPVASSTPLKNPLKLSNKEQEIFNDLLNNKLTDVNIDGLINSGVLTENMIEKFLTKMKNPSNKVTEATEDADTSEQSSEIYDTSDTPDSDETVHENFENFEIQRPPLNRNSNVPRHLRVEAFTGFTSLTPMYATATTPDSTISTTNRIYSQY